jgi:glutaredoxin
MVLYSKPDCRYCDLLKQNLESRNLYFIELKIGTDILRNEFRNKFPDVKTVPYLILANGDTHTYSSWMLLTEPKEKT